MCKCNIIVLNLKYKDANTSYDDKLVKSIYMTSRLWVDRISQSQDMVAAYKIKKIVETSYQTHK